MASRSAERANPPLGCLFTVYDVSGAGSDRSVVVLNDIHIDIMDYIVPATCTDAEFRQMWAEFEWENKVSVHTTLSDLREYLAHLLKSTNMRCLTPEKVRSFIFFLYLYHQDKTAAVAIIIFFTGSLWAMRIYGSKYVRKVDIRRGRVGESVY